MSNVVMGVLSAIVDNIPIMFAVLKMNPHDGSRPMAADHVDSRCRRQPLLCRFGGRRCIDGSFARPLHIHGHLRWTWAIALGYAAGILTHLVLNVHHFEVAAGG